jgi:hypothetical protein
MKISCYPKLLLAILFPAVAIPLSATSTVRDSLKSIEQIVIPAGGAVVNETVAHELREAVAPMAAIIEGSGDLTKGGPETILVGVAGEPGIQQPEAMASLEEWMLFQPAEGSHPARLIASHRHLIYSLFCKLTEDWMDEPVSSFSEGRVIRPSFPHIYGEDGFYGFWRRFCRGYEPEAAMREAARLGVSRMPVNALPQPISMEDGPAGEIYFRFYQYLPDMDQFVETKLNEGIYPSEYLATNLAFLKEQAALAVKYGITPGMHVANPRSVPEKLFDKYPYLRGARVDHTFRSYRPRYTLSLAHPLARWHYAELIRKLLTEVPDIGFLITLINDSGSGFEYTESLYPGRNGGPYVVREWSTHQQVARAAAENIIRYYRTLMKAAREVNPEFRILLGLNNIKEEKGIIYEGLVDGLDRIVRTQRMNIVEDRERNQLLEARGSYRVGAGEAEGNPYLLGIPAPWHTYERLKGEYAAGTSRLELSYDPPVVVPYDVNRAVLRAFQFDSEIDLEEVIKETAQQFVGTNKAAELTEIWKITDEAVQSLPFLPLYGNLGFMWYRFWVRPFVPDIAKIPVSERAYYEDYMLTIFNNPHNVDMQADALWDIGSAEEYSDFLATFDETSLPLIEKAIGQARHLEADLPGGHPGVAVASDLVDRLRAYHCFARTLRNLSSWIVGVHGYLDSESDEDRTRHLAIVREMVADELANARDLLELWNSTDVVFMPIHEKGEWMHDYGPNFGELLENKIHLMEAYGDAEPYIDPDYMWRLPEPDEVELAPEIDPEEYMKY